MELLLERFVYHTEQTSSVDEGLRTALTDVARAAVADVAGGVELDVVFARVGIPDPKPLAAHVQNHMKRFHIPCDEPAIVHYVVTAGPTVGGVPHPGCMEKHLPRNRKPTTEELIRAFRLCSGQA